MNTWVERLMDRRAVALVLAALVTVLGTPRPSAAAPENKPFKGEYDAAGAPVGPYFTTDDCMADTQPVSATLEIPGEGRLKVEMTEFVGDWDIWLNTEDEMYYAGSYDSQTAAGDGIEAFTAIFKEAQSIVLIACNYTGGPTAHVEYRYEPGDFSSLDVELPLQERLPVNFVFVGFDEKQVRAEFEERLPKYYRPVVRTRSDRNHQEYLGIEHVFDHNLVFAERGYEDRLFDWLKAHSTKASVNPSQNSYSAQPEAAEEITTNTTIPAAGTERWLAMNPPEGVDTKEHTAYFINWHGRKDFRFHVYNKIGEPDSDTGFDTGTLPNSQTVAWGGTAPSDDDTPMPNVRRVWFYDMSAGPDWRTGNWSLAKGTGYRILPSWEYGPGKARPSSKVGDDLGKLARYVAIDMLFTPSPLYPPSITPPAHPLEINLDMNTYEGDRSVDASVEATDAKKVLSEVRDLLPLDDLSRDEQDLDYFDPSNVRCTQSYTSASYVGAQGAWPVFLAPSCYPDRGYGYYANFFLHNALNLGDVLDDEETVDYEATGFGYALPPNTPSTPFSGLADNNYRDGTQSFVYVVSWPALRNAGYGMTDTWIHEYGHHFGLSHPHDGWDSQGKKILSPSGWSYFIWAGDESNGVMSYLNTNNDFSQFDRDNMDRWRTAAYLAQVKKIGKQLESQEPSAASALAGARVEDHVDHAIELFAGHDYFGALRAAREAYVKTLAVAQDLGVTVEGSTTGREVAESASPAPLPFVPPAAFTDFWGPERPGFERVQRLMEAERG